MKITLKIKNLWRWASLTGLSTVLGCTTPVTPDFMEMSTKYANLLETYQINMMFTNIMRASFQEPLSFLDMPNINGSGSITNAPSVNSVFATPSVFGKLGSVGTQWALAFGNSFTFTQSSLDNATFWKGMEADIPTESIRYFLHNHIPREVVFSLVIDEIETSDSQGRKAVYINNPLRPGYPSFQKELYTLLALGLTIESSQAMEKIGSPMSESQLSMFYSTNIPVNVDGQSIEIKKISNAPVKLYQRYKTYQSFKFCFPRNKNQSEIQKKYGDSIFCDAGKSKEGSQSSSLTNLKIQTRSTRKIYYFLGEVVASQLKESNSYLITLPPTDSTFNDKVGESNQYALFVVDKNKALKNPFASYEALDGNTYSVPRVNNGYSSIIIDMLTQFQTMAKVPGSVPPSPAVIIR
jgi:hypothetical protein